MRPFGCHVTILNTLDSLGKFDGKLDEGFLVGYSTKREAKGKSHVESDNSINEDNATESEDITYSDNEDDVGAEADFNNLETSITVSSGPIWLFNIDTLTKTMIYQPVTTSNQFNPSVGFQDKFDAEKSGEKSDQQYVLFLVWSTGSTNPQNTDGDVAFDKKEPEFEGSKLEFEVNVSPSSSAQSKKHDDKTKREAKGKSHVESDNSINEDNATGTLVPAVGQISPNNTNTFSVVGPSNVVASPTHGKYSCIDTSSLPDDPDMPESEDITYSDNEDDVGAEADFNNLETSITEFESFTHTNTHTSPLLTPTSLSFSYHPYSLIMSSLFADTHNVVAILEKSDAAEGFEQIIDFLSGSYIHYALTVIPHIYILCIKQFWNTASVKRTGDVTRLQAIVDKKKIVIFEAVIHEILQLNDAEGVNQVGDLSTYTTRFISPVLTQKVFANMRRVAKEEGLVVDQVQVNDAVAAPVKENVAEDVVHDAIPPPPLHDIPSPSQEPSSPPQQQQSTPQAPLQDVEFPSQLQQVLNVCSALSKRIENLENDNAAQKLVIVKLKARVKKQAEIYNLDLDHSSKVLSMQEDDSEVQEVVEVVTTAKLITEVVTASASQVSGASTTISAASATIPAAKPTIPAAAPTDKGKGILVETPKPMKKKDQIELDVEYAKKLHEEINKDYEEFDENMRFLFKSREEMEEEDQEIIKSINETHAHKAAKRRKLSEEAQEAEDLRKRLEVVEDEDDDVFVEATQLASKVSVVDYKIVLIDNKPRFKIIRADETHQFYISFATLLKNFDREDLENLWRIVKDRFSTSKPTNFSDEYLLLTLKKMFEEPDGQDAIWRNQKRVHGLALVKRWKLLTSCSVHVITLLIV
nr:retrovirus-related Pol polyprotein from transposon TNT 1-94 [Tanacetum cinerariifolium]